MIAYRHDDDTLTTRPAWESLCSETARLVDEDDPERALSVFIDLGELEAGIADSLFPSADGRHPLTSALRDAAVASARVLLGTGTAAALARTLASVPTHELPASVNIRVPEGYAYYGVHPEAYAAAAARFARDARPPAVICIGIRSVGTSLSAAATAAFEHAGVRAASCTVRPHGHPYDRRLALRDDLVAWLRASAGATFVVIDEGPGLSGSSFASVSDALMALGIDADRIVLFPSWDPDAGWLRSSAARQAWSRHRRVVVPADEIGLSPVRIARATHERHIDFSAGQWRASLLRDEAAWPAVQPQHERRKIFLPDRGEIVRFAGLGKYGAAREDRAQQLAGRGFGAQPLWRRQGYLALEFVEGDPCTPNDAGPEMIDALADYLAFVAGEFPASRKPAVDALFEMTAVNLREAGLPAIDLESYRSVLDDAPACAIDGRMLTHDWLRTAGGFAKTDALDHHADHFLPGTQDAGWDLAAAILEFSLAPEAATRLVERYIAATGDRDIVRRLPFYAVAYPAFRVGYCTLAREALGDGPDAHRFARDLARYTAAIPSAP